VKVEGFDEISRSLNQLAERARALGETHTVSATELLTPAFIRAHTRSAHEAVDTWFVASPFKIETTEDFDTIPDSEWDQYVRSTTDFESWEEMLAAATQEYIHGRLVEG
jgi:hypothetical protein